MKKLIAMALSLTLLGAYAVFPVHAAEKQTETISYTYDAGRWETYKREMEKLDRGLVAIKSGNSVYLSWRLLDSEDARFGSAESNVSFNVYRGNTKIAEVTNSTNYTDTQPGTSYSVAPIVGGREGEKCAAVSVRDNSYFDIELVTPETETIYDPNGNVSGTYSFFPADCSTGDLDGDGEYEIIVKWTSAEKDVGSPGDIVYSGTIRFAAYKLDGTRLWKNDINLGKNVYSSAHTAQFLVYDFNGDGKAEMTVQTSLGSTDAAGNYVSRAADPVNNADIYAYTDTENAETDYRGIGNGGGRIVYGEEFLTVFSGETGEAIDTIPLPTARIPNNYGQEFGDDFGNRSNRFMASVAYLDGEKPYAVYSRGYYFGRNGKQRTSIAGISFDGTRLNAKYRFDTEKGQPGYFEGAYDYVGNGNHNCTVADVDNDGKDEYMTGALCMEVDDNDEFRPRWCTHQEHGDALHIGDYDPTHEGFEFFIVHEDGDKDNASGGYGYTNSQGQWCDFGMSVVDANDGTIMFHHNAPKDTGRGMMANVGSGGYYQINSANAGNYQCNGNTNFTQINNGMSVNFRVFWDGDLYDELLDGTTITSWNGRRMNSIFNAGNNGCVQINGSKANPSLQADLFGDWREEVIYPLTDGSALRVFTTTTPTEYKIKTLMHDPVYRMGVSAEQTAYNQPPHTGLYLGTELFAAEPESLTIITPPDKTVYALGDELDTSGMVVQVTRSDGTKENVTIYSVTGFDSSKSGKQTLTVTYMGVSATFDITVKSVSSISVTPPSKLTYSQGQDLNTSGMEVTAVYNDGTSRVIPAYSCEVTGYNPDLLGEQTVTVTYAGKKAYFKVTVREPAISLIDGTYETTSTASSHTDTEVGNYSGNFTIEHKVTVNSMPANGNDNKEINSGFFLRFMNFSEGHTGGGWYLTQSGSQAQVVWKNTKTSSVGKIDIGKTYTFRYEFTNVGTGVGATAKLTILDEAGNQVASASNLNLRNFSDTNTGKSAPITSIQIFNQANANSTASVTIAGAIVYDASRITQVSGSDITVNMASLGNVRIFAAKYEGGALSDVQELVPAKLGESTLNANIEPDKVFMWTNDMRPIDYCEKPN